MFSNWIAFSTVSSLRRSARTDDRADTILMEQARPGAPNPRRGSEQSLDR